MEFQYKKKVTAVLFFIRHLSIGKELRMDGLVAECTDQCQTINGLHTAHSIKTDLSRSNTRARLSGLDPSFSLCSPCVQYYTTNIHSAVSVLGQVSDRAAFNGEQGRKNDILMFFQTV